MYFVNNVFVWLMIILLALMIIGLVIYVLPWILIGVAVIWPVAWVMEKIERRK